MPFFSVYVAVASENIPGGGVVTTIEAGIPGGIWLGDDTSTSVLDVNAYSSSETGTLTCSLYSLVTGELQATYTFPVGASGTPTYSALGGGLAEVNRAAKRTLYLAPAGTGVRLDFSTTNPSGCTLSSQFILQGTDRLYPTVGVLSSAASLSPDYYTLSATMVCLAQAAFSVRFLPRVGASSQQTHAHDRASGRSSLVASTGTGTVGSGELQAEVYEGWQDLSGTPARATSNILGPDGLPVGGQFPHLVKVASEGLASLVYQDSGGDIVRAISRDGLLTLEAPIS